MSLLRSCGPGAAGAVSDCRQSDGYTGDDLTRRSRSVVFANPLKRAGA
jgi:hypothetical protein